MKSKAIAAFFLLFVLSFTCIFATRIMVIHSYDEDYIWSREMLEGIKSVFNDEAIEWKVFYLDTRLQTNEEWKIKAGKMAAQEVEAFQPDIVIACDDNAQEYFAKDFTTLPLVYCGVNLDLERYSYPRSNATGVRETLFSKETVAMLLDFFPQVREIHFIGDDSETVAGMREQLEATSFDDISTKIHMVGSFNEWKEVVKNISGEGNAIVILADRTLKDENGRTVSTEYVTEWTVENTDLPVFSVLDFVVADGAMAGVVNSAFEEGKQAGVIALKILSGLSPEEIPPENSSNGRSMVNIEALLSAGVELDSYRLEEVDDLISQSSVPVWTALNLLVTSFQERVHGIMTSLRVLASSPEVISGEWSRMKPLLSSFNRGYEGLAMYVEPDGDYYTVQRDRTGLNLSDRGYFPALLMGEEVLGYQVLSRSTGKRSVVFATTVLKEGNISGFVGISAFLDEWNFELISDFKQLPGVHFYAFDGQNTLALSDDTSLLLGSLEVPVPGMSKRLAALDRDNGDFLFSANDVLHLATYRRSLKTGWTFVVARELLSTTRDQRPELLLSEVQKEIQEHFNRLDASLAKGAEDMRKVLDDDEEVRSLLKRLYEANPEVVDVSYIDLDFILRSIHPQDYSYVEGEWIGDQEQLIRLHETGRPVLSEGFLAVEGFQAVDLEWPVFAEDGSLEGSLSFLIKPETFLAPIIVPSNLEPYEFWIMQPDGTIFYDQDSLEVGRNLFEDELYEPFDELVELGHSISKSESGQGYYTFYSRGLSSTVKKEVWWSSIGLHGTQWRLILTKVIGPISVSQ